MKLYFRDNFFNAGEMPILDEQQEEVGTVDLKSSFGSSINVYGADGSLRCSGEFRFLSNKWEVTGPSGEACGVLRHRMSLFDKKYEYEGMDGTYEITSPVFSKEYTVMDENGRVVAEFAKVDGWWGSGAYCLESSSTPLDGYEWIAVIMGVHEIQKRHRH